MTGNVNLNSPGDKPRFKVLVANDDSIQLMIILRVLNYFGDNFEIIDSAENG